MCNKDFNFGCKVSEAHSVRVILLVVQKLRSLHDFSPNIFTFQKRGGSLYFQICNFLIVAVSSAEISCMNAMTQLFLTLFDAGTVKAGVCQGKK